MSRFCLQFMKFVRKNREAYRFHEQTCPLLSPTVSGMVYLFEKQGPPEM